MDRGIAAETAGDSEEALQSYRRAIELDPEYPPAHMNLGIALQAIGELPAAVEAYDRALAIDPEYAAAHYNRGLAQLRLDDYSKAEADFRAALRFKPSFAEAWVGLANALEALGRNEAALAALKNAIAQREDYSGALFNAGALARKLGDFKTAVEYERRALEIEPERYIEHHGLGALLNSLERPHEAEARYRTALALNPDFIEAQIDLAAVLKQQGRKQESVQLLFDAAARWPDSAEVRRSLVASLLDFPLTSANDKERSILLSLCREADVSMRFLSAPIIGLLMSSNGFARLEDCARHGEDPFAAGDPAVTAYLQDPLLLAALPRILILNEALERVLTYVRRCILLRFDAQSGAQTIDPAVPADLVCALAGQCFFAGYHFYAADEEKRRVILLRQGLEARLREPSIDPAGIERALSVLAMYEYLDSVVGRERLLQQPSAGWSLAFRPVVQQQLENRRRERQIAKQMPAITTIADPVSIDVRSQYEEQPYPVWVGNVPGVEAETVEALAKRLRPDRPLHVATRPVPVLVAGCGTGERLVQLARQHPDAEVLAVDLSLASLSFAARMSEQLGIPNITYRQADILELDKLGRRFAMIECSGVLHHLDDPMEGWRILVDLLEPDGVMKIALYSAKARQILQAAKELIRSLDLPRTPDGVRACRRAIMELPDGHEARQPLTCADFFTLNGCRDLLMHVKEHQFTLPGIAACLDQLGLRFLGMECSHETRRRFLQMTGDANAANDLAAWDRYEQAHPSTFIGMYPFWCCKD